MFMTAGAIAYYATDWMALALLTPPADIGADYCYRHHSAIWDSSRYGGPHAAFFSN